MKRLLIILSLVGSTIFTSSYAAATNTVPEVTQAFQSTFYGAKDVSWEQVGVLYKVTFAINGQYASAFYNGDGELIAQTRNLTTLQLPDALQASLKQDVQGYWITDVFAVTIEGESTYYVKIENANTGILLKSAGTNKWDVYKKNDK